MDFLLESTTSTASRVSTTRMENKKLCNVLLKWLQTLHLKSPHRTLYEITDGVALAEALNQIAPECFDDNWFSKIKKDVGSNWRLKVSNLKKIVEKIHDFYQDCDPQHMGNFVKPDVIKIGDQDDTMELARLLQLILGCAVNCRNAQNYITNIRSMDENSQTVIMQSIQDLERVQGHPQNSITVNSIGVDIVNQDQIRQLIEELESVTKTRDQMTQRCLELDSQISLLQEEKIYILEEKRHLEERLLESVEDPLKGRGQRRQIEDLKEELYKAETSRDDLRMKLETQEAEMVELKTKFELLQETAGEARLLKDELDILRDTADKVEKYESTILSYKKKLEELGDLKRQIKILETKNIAYIQQNMELEQEVKKASVWKSQLELYKKQVTELHNTLNNETNKIDKLEFETKKLSENLNALQKEKDRLVIERDSLKEANEELKCCQSQIKNISSVEHSQTTEDMESAMDLKQKLVRLQHENNMLKMNQKDPDEDKISVLQTLLDNSRQQYNELRLDYRKSNQKILELESELKERSDEMTNEWRSKIKELQSQLQCEKDTRSMDLEEKNSAISDKDQLINMLQVSLHQKDLEIQEWEEKYKKNLQKAKSVVKCMDSKNIALSDVDTSVLENRLIKANKELNDLKREQESNKRLLDTEEKLMSTAFYKLAQSKMQEAVDQRVMNQGLLHSHTFLSKHRQQTNKSVELPIISK